MGRDTAMGKEHPAVKNKYNLSKVLPIIWHVDGGEMFKRTEYDVWSFQSLTAGLSGNVFDLKFPSHVMQTALLATKKIRREAQKRIAQYLGYCHKYALLNEGPDQPFDSESFDRRLAGKPLMRNGWRAAFVGCKADAKARMQVNNFIHYYNTTHICDGCFATQAYKKAPKPLLFGDFGDDALWKSTVISHEAYMAMTPTEELSCLHEIDGWRKELSYRDWMHNNYLGASRDHLASLIFDMLECGCLGNGKPEELLMDLFIEFKRDWCPKNGLVAPPGGFTLASLGRGDATKTCAQR